MNNSKWWQQAVIYQVYPKSFQDSNQDGLGDLRGIISRLDYIKQLGADVIWLNPVYKTANIDGGYDISDYQSINPDLGTMSDFDALVTEAHQRGLKIMMDLVVNHTSSDHDWFKQSRSSTDNPYRDYYIWRDPVDGHEPNNWGSFFSGPAWTYDEQSQQYYLHLFAKEQPDLNWDNPEVRKAIFRMMNWWAAKGIDGFRMDVISLISKPNNLTDDHAGKGQPYEDAGQAVANGPHVHQYLKEMNQEVLSKYDWITVGETAGVTTEQADKYANLDGSELNMVFQFEHVSLDGNVNPILGKWSDRRVSLVDLRENLVKWQTQLAGKAWNSLYWNNHDQPRAVSRFGDDDPQYRDYSAKMLGAMLHFMQGTPYIYQGEELGMTNSAWHDLSQYRDLESLNAYHEFVDKEALVSPETMLRYLQTTSRDNARTPMQWDNSQYAGFSQNKPWLPVNDNHTEVNAQQQLSDSNSVFNFYKQLIKWRHTLPVVTNGTFSLVTGNEKDTEVFAYTRQNSDQTLLVIANFTANQLTRHYDIPSDHKLIVQNYTDDQGSTLRPYETKVYLYQSTAATD